MPNNNREINEVSHFYLIAGLIAGFILLIASFAFLFLSHTLSFNLTLCIGLGLVLGALGTTATVKFKGHVITGSGAIGVLLFFIIQNADFKNVTFGMIHGPFTSGTQIIIEDDVEILGAIRGQSRKTYMFVIQGQKLKSNSLSIDIDGTLIGVDRKFIDPYLVKDATIEWNFDSLENLIIDTRTRDTIGHLNLTCKDPSKESAIVRWTDRITGFVFGNAFADTMEVRSMHQSLINDLSSGNIRLSKSSMEKLATLGSATLPELKSGYLDSTASVKFRSNVIRTLALMRKQSKLDLITVLDDDFIAGITRTAFTADGIDAKYAKMFLDTLRTSDDTLKVNKLAEIINKTLTDSITGTIWKVNNFIDNILYFKLQDDFTALYGKKKDAVTNDNEKWEWRVNNDSLILWRPNETFTINLFSHENRRCSATVSKKGKKHETWAELVR
jgi:hypothetical protein